MIKFDEPVYVTEGENEYIKLRLVGWQSKQEARRFIGEKPDKIHTATFKVFREKRSAEANAKAWTLIHKLAEVLMLPPDELYRGYVKDVGKFDQYLMREDAFKAFSEAWEKDHIGRFALILGNSKEHPGYLWVAVYQGSSDFDTREMSIMLNNIIEDAKVQGIETMSPRELEELLDRWESYSAKE